ncbi:MAG: hypothetical protein WCY10_02665, partial [Candidatus Omnitrophota bacterium]
MLRKITALFIIFCLAFEQSGFAQVAPQLNVPAYLSGYLSPDRFRPVHLRSFSIDPNTHNINLILDKGDAKTLSPSQVQDASRILFQYFQIGLSLPNSMFWVNLRPDDPANIIDPYVEKTDLGKVLLEADLQLKKDMAACTSPDTKEGRAYWNKLYSKAESLFGQSDMEIPTVTRPWIVPGEIIMAQSQDSAYVYKATLKVMLEQDYLKDAKGVDSSDPRFNELNEYSSQLIREAILPKLTREVNSAKRYAGLRQVYYSLILAQWYKWTKQSALFAAQIDRRNLDGLTSKTQWSKQTYYEAYKKSFQQGEYNREETVSSQGGLTIRRYFSGGLRTTVVPEDIMVLPFKRVVGSQITEYTVQLNTATGMFTTNDAVLEKEVYSMGDGSGRGGLDGGDLSEKQKEDILKKVVAKYKKASFLERVELNDDEIRAVVWSMVSGDQKIIELFDQIKDMRLTPETEARFDKLLTFTIAKKVVRLVSSVSDMKDGGSAARAKKTDDKQALSAKDAAALVESIRDVKTAREIFVMLESYSAADLARVVKEYSRRYPGAVKGKFIASALEKAKRDNNPGKPSSNGRDGGEAPASDQAELESLFQVLRASLRNVERYRESAADEGGYGGGLNMYSLEQRVKQVVTTREEFERLMEYIGDQLAISNDKWYSFIPVPRAIALANAYNMLGILGSSNMLKFDKDASAPVTEGYVRLNNGFTAPGALTLMVWRAFEAFRDSNIGMARDLAMSARYPKMFTLRETTETAAIAAGLLRSDGSFDNDVRNIIIASSDGNSVLEFYVRSPMVTQSSRDGGGNSPHVNKTLERLKNEDFTGQLEGAANGASYETVKNIGSGRLADLGFELLKGERVNRLGWTTTNLKVIRDGLAGRTLDDVIKDGKELKENYKYVIFCGMGGSGLSVQFVKDTFRNEAAENIYSLRTTDPTVITLMFDEIAKKEGSLKAALDKTAIVLVSKSATTPETVEHREYFERVYKAWGLDAGKNLWFITDTISPWGVEAQKNPQMRQREIQLNARGDVGGRFTAPGTNVFLLPMAVVAPDSIKPIIDKAIAMNGANDDVFPRLGAFLFNMAKNLKKDKLTIIVPAELKAFPMWAEQLIEESLGKDGKGVTLFYDERDLDVSTLKPAASNDRVFLRVNLGSEKPRADLWKHLTENGYPTYEINLNDLEDTGGLMLGLQISVAIVGYLWNICFVNQPAVEGYKIASKDMKKAIENAGSDIVKVLKNTYPNSSKKGSLTFYYDPLIQIGGLKIRDIQEQVRLFNSTMEDPAAVYAAILFLLKDRIEAGEFASYGSMTDELREVLENARSDIFTRGLNMPAKISIGPDKNHAFQQNIEDGKNMFFSQYFLPLRVVQPEDVDLLKGTPAFSDLMIKAQTLGTVQSMIKNSRKVILITSDLTAEESAVEMAQLYKAVAGYLAAAFNAGADDNRPGYQAAAPIKKMPGKIQEWGELESILDEFEQAVDSLDSEVYFGLGGEFDNEAYHSRVDEMIRVYSAQLGLLGVEALGALEHKAQEHVVVSPRSRHIDTAIATIKARSQIFDGKNGVRDGGNDQGLPAGKSVISDLQAVSSIAFLLSLGGGIVAMLSAPVLGYADFTGWIGVGTIALAGITGLIYKVVQTGEHKTAAQEVDLSAAKKDGGVSSRSLSRIQELYSAINEIRWMSSPGNADFVAKRLARVADMIRENKYTPDEIVMVQERLKSEDTVSERISSGRMDSVLLSAGSVITGALTIGALFFSGVNLWPMVMGIGMTAGFGIAAAYRVDKLLKDLAFRAPLDQYYEEVGTMLAAAGRDGGRALLPSTEALKLTGDQEHGKKFEELMAQARSLNPWVGVFDVSASKIMKMIEDGDFTKDELSKVINAAARVRISANLLFYLQAMLNNTWWSCAAMFIAIMVPFDLLA